MGLVVYEMVVKGNTYFYDRSERDSLFEVVRLYNQAQFGSGNPTSNFAEVYMNKVEGGEVKRVWLPAVNRV